MEEGMVHQGGDDWILIGAVIMVAITAIVLFLIAMRSRPAARARRLVRRAMEIRDRPDEALKLLDSAYHIDPQNIGILHSAVSIALVAQNWGRAVEYLKELDSRGHMTMAERLQLGGALSLMGQHHECISLLQGIPETNPYFVRALYLTGLAFSELEDYDAAIATYKRGPLRKRKLDQDLLHLHYGIAEALEAAGKHAEAARHYRRVYVVDINFRDVKTKVGI